MTPSSRVPPTRYVVERLGPPDRARANALFAMMAAVFEEPQEELGDGYLDRLLARDDFFVLAASASAPAEAGGAGALVGGLTAHALPMTRAEATEIFVYDVAVHASHQRRGVGRLLMSHLEDISRGPLAAELFVAADDEDEHALDFYRALGGKSSPVTVFTFSR